MTGSEPRVVVTGLGAVTAHGLGIDRLWAALLATDDGPVRGRIESLPPPPGLAAKEVRRSAPFTLYALAAAIEAHEHGGSPALDPVRTGVVTSTLYGALDTVEDVARAFDAAGAEVVSPYYSSLACENAPAGAVSQHFGARGPSKAVLGACAGGGFAIADGADLIRSGRCTAVLAGASQGVVTPAMTASYANLRVLSDDGWLRPFDRRRSGFVLAEGAAFLLLEEADAARARGATVLAEIAGWANTNDAVHPVRPSGQGAIECMTAALAHAGLPPDAVGCVSAHGTGTIVNDRLEAAAVNAVFGRPGPAVTSIKRVTGHLFGASGALEAVAAVLTLRDGVVPAAALDLEPDPEIDVDLVVGSARSYEPAAIVSNSFGLGGHNCTLVISPPPPV